MPALANAHRKKAAATKAQASCEGALASAGVLLLSLSCPRLPPLFFQTHDGGVMAKIIDMAEARRRIRDQMAKGIRQGDKDADIDVEADKLLLSFAKSLDEAPLAQHEKLLALYMKLIETLTSLDDERDRNRYAKIFEKHLRQNMRSGSNRKHQRELSDELRKAGKEEDDELRNLTDGDEWFP